MTGTTSAVGRTRLMRLGRPTASASRTSQCTTRIRRSGLPRPTAPITGRSRPANSISGRRLGRLTASTSSSRTALAQGDCVRERRTDDRDSGRLWPAQSDRFDWDRRGQPDWSPDGRSIVFVGLGHPRLEQIDVDGSNRRDLGFDGSNPRYSPNGTEIAFTEQVPVSGCCGYDLAAIRPDGTGHRMITNTAWRNFNPSWSPDGAYIVFDSDFNEINTDPEGWDEEIAIVPSAGGQPIRIKGTSERERNPDWRRPSGATSTATVFAWGRNRYHELGLASDAIRSSSPARSTACPPPLLLLGTRPATRSTARAACKRGERTSGANWVTGALNPRPSRSSSTGPDRERSGTAGTEVPAGCGDREAARSCHPSESEPSETAGRRGSIGSQRGTSLRRGRRRRCRRTCADRDRGSRCALSRAGASVRRGGRRAQGCRASEQST